MALLIGGEGEVMVQVVGSLDYPITGASLVGQVPSETERIASDQKPPLILKFGTRVAVPASHQSLLLPESGNSNGYCFGDR